MNATGYANHCAKDFLLCEDITNNQVSIANLIFSIPIIVYGTIAATPNSQSTIDYSYAGFIDNPIVIVTPVSTVSGTICRIEYGTISSTHASITIESTYTGETPINWVAIGTRERAF